MARLVKQAGLRSTPLSSGWAWVSVPPGAAGSPPPSGLQGWRAAIVPGPVPAAADDLHGSDHWYRLETPLPGEASLEFGGLATLAEIWIDGALLATSANMFVPLTVGVPPLGASRLELCFRALRPSLRRRQPGPRARWRSRLVTEEELRHYRTTLLGHMPGWSGDGAVIGPVRPIVLHEPIAGAPVVTAADLRADGTGRVTLLLEGSLSGRAGTLTVAGRTTPLLADGDRLRATLCIDDPPLWWPHTHGTPTTVPVHAEIDGAALDLGRIGFRTVARRDPAAGFGLLVNDVPIFCRGAVWTGLDPTACEPAPAALEQSLGLARQAGLNMLRVCGMTTYADPEFLRLCDDLGIMVWHDFMFSRFDYPDGAEFQSSARREAAAFLDRAQAHPCLAVLCGGTENAQSAAMSGRPPGEWHAPLFDGVLAAQAALFRPDVPYLPQSPLAAPGGDVPFAAAATVSHYFGVGAYERPLDDLRSAGIRFAGECLAFANLPEPASDRSGRAVPARDLGAAWDFAEVRDRYVCELFGAAASTIRRQDPAAWNELGRVCVAAIMHTALSIWRSDGICAGALVLMWQDLVPGAGWGIVAADGRPKSAWYAIRNACQPVQVLLRDLGHNGVELHAINETAVPRRLQLGLRGLSREGEVELLGQAALELAPRESRKVRATSLMGRWRDLANAWQFGPPGFAVVGATLDCADTGARLSSAELFPTGLALPPGKAHLEVAFHEGSVEVGARRFAQFVQIDDDRHVPADNYFHLWPGETRTVPLMHRFRRGRPGVGTVRAINDPASVAYEIAA